MSSLDTKDVRAIILEGRLVQRALQQAWANTLVRHKRLGNPIVVWRDGKVVWVPAEEIEVPTSGPNEIPNGP